MMNRVMHWGPQLHGILPHEPQEVHVPTPMVYVTEVRNWQYKQVVRDLSKESPLNEEELNKLGAEGWELSGVLSHGTLANFYFKRLSA
jgi:hypothetical protein